MKRFSQCPFVPTSVGLGLVLPVAGRQRDGIISTGAPDGVFAPSPTTAAGVFSVSVGCNAWPARVLVGEIHKAKDHHAPGRFLRSLLCSLPTLARAFFLCLLGGSEARSNRRGHRLGRWLAVSPVIWRGAQ